MRGIIAAVALVAVWVTAGVAFGATIPEFVLLGVAAYAVFHLGARRLSLISLAAPDSSFFGRRWKRYASMAAALVLVPGLMAQQTIASGHWVDGSWAVLLMAGALTGGYLILRRLLATLVVAALVVLGTSWALAPSLASERQGDPVLLSELTAEEQAGALDGYRGLLVAEVTPGADRPVRVAGLGIADDTPIEVGSMTKAMTGLVIADSVRRGELDLSSPVSAYLPGLGGSPAGEVTMRELVTHTAGYVNVGSATRRRAIWTAPLGRNFFDTDLDQMMAEARAGDLSTRGSYVYSNLGAAIAGQATAAAAGMPYADLMRKRLFEPLGMDHTMLQDDHPLVEVGTSASGFPVRPWVFGAYSPAGAVVSTVGDIATFASAILDERAPGLSALEPTTPTSEPNTRIGIFWHVTTTPGQTIAWHQGLTGGYAAYLGIDRANDRAVILLSDVAVPGIQELGSHLLARR